MGGLRDGDAVLVTKLKKIGVITELLPNGRYRVSIGSLTLVCRKADLEPAKNPSPSQRQRSFERQIKGPKPRSSLDLHGHTVDDAIRKLDEWLSAVVLSELSHVKVVHGLGTGRIQEAVHRRLGELKAVRRFKVNEFNPGETDIYL